MPDDDHKDDELYGFLVELLDILTKGDDSEQLKRKLGMLRDKVAAARPPAGRRYNP